MGEGSEAVCEGGARARHDRVQRVQRLALPMANFDAVFGTTTGGALSTLVEGSLTSGFEKMASIAGEKLESESPAELLQGKQQVGEAIFALPVCCVGNSETVGVMSL